MFAAYYEQTDGCDYTIACGKKLFFFPEEIDTYAKAINYLHTPDEWNILPIPDGDDRLDKVTIIEYSKIHPFDIKDYYRKVDDGRAAVKRQEKEDADRAEFERLSAKFGKKV